MFSALPLKADIVQCGGVVRDHRVLGPPTLIFTASHLRETSWDKARRLMVAYFFQSIIIFAVVASNIHWQWTPNGYLAVGLGVAVAYALTQLAVTIASWCRDAGLSPKSKPRDARRSVTGRA
jgi:hypothetical protein